MFLFEKRRGEEREQYEKKTWEKKIAMYWTDG
jgi:hypothetical protein